MCDILFQPCISMSLLENQREKHREKRNISKIMLGDPDIARQAENGQSRRYI